MAGKFGNKRQASSRVRRMPKFWSFSREKDYGLCPARYEYAHILKLRGPENPKMAEGSKVHNQGERYLAGELKGVPARYKDFRTEMITLRKMEFKPEQSWAVTKTWQPCSPTDWDHAWLRAKGDAAKLNGAVLDAIDYKTGRFYPDHGEQAEIIACVGLSVHPDAEQCDVEFWYLDHGEVGPYSFHRDQLRGLKKKWNARARKMLSATTFPRTPGPDACKFCPFRSDKRLQDGSPGPCDGWKRV